MQDKILRKTVEVNGLSLSYLEKGEGALILCLHGYPDSAESWVDTIELLSGKGYRVVAPSLRGYVPSGIPADRDYSVLALAEDILRLIDVFGAEQAILIGHDWGALASCSAAALAPEKIAKLITVDMPHPASIQFSLKTAWKTRHILMYQFKKGAVKRLTRNNFSHVDEIYRRWSPQWDFDETETEIVKAGFAQPGRAEAALGYYWSFFAGLTRSDERAKKGRAVALATIDVPSLCIMGDWGATDLVTMERSRRFFKGPYQFHMLSDVGHFLHREDPERFFSLILPFLIEG